MTVEVRASMVEKKNHKKKRISRTEITGNWKNNLYLLGKHHDFKRQVVLREEIKSF